MQATWYRIILLFLSGRRAATFTELFSSSEAPACRAPAGFSPALPHWMRPNSANLSDHFAFVLKRPSRPMWCIYSGHHLQVHDRSVTISRKGRHCVGANVLVEVPHSFEGYVDASLVRLQARFPGLAFSRCQNGLLVEGASVGADIRAAVLHTLYREKIYQETLPMREALLTAVLT